MKTHNMNMALAEELTARLLNRAEEYKSRGVQKGAFYNAILHLALEATDEQIAAIINKK